MALAKFWRNKSASMAVYTGLTLPVVAVGVGGAMDYSQAYERRAALQKATDAAVLNAVVTPAESDTQRIENARNFFLSSPFCQSVNCGDPSISIEEGGVHINARIDSPTTLLKVIGWSSVEVGAVSRALPPSATPVEVVMLLDYSGSMGQNNRYQDMAAAAKAFLTNAQARSGDNIMVGIAPFARYVLTPMNGAYLYDVEGRSDLTGRSVVGCVLNREYPFSVSVDTPNTGEEGSLWPIFSYVIGSSPTGSGYSDDYAGPEIREMSVSHVHDDDDDEYHHSHSFRYVNVAEEPYYEQPAFDGATYIDGYDEFAMEWLDAAPDRLAFRGNMEWPQNSDMPAYGGYGDSSNWVSNDGNGEHPPSNFDDHAAIEELDPECAEYAKRKLWLRPLSMNFDEMSMAIDAMTPGGATNIALALDLGWHMLSPNAPFEDSQSEPQTTSTRHDAGATSAGRNKNNVTRFAILLTDGVQTVEAHGQGGEYSVRSANENIEKLCKAMKRNGVALFTIAFAIEDHDTRRLLNDCASAKAYHYETDDGADLGGVFDGIFKTISPSRPRLSG